MILASVGALVVVAILAVLFGILVVLYVVGRVADGRELRRQRAAGARKIVCPYCGETGTVTTQAKTVKVGISGGKATGAILTNGLSLLATGLSRKQTGQQLTCSNCRMSWFVA